MGKDRVTHSRTRRTFAAWTGAAAVAVLVASCSSSGGSDKPSGGDSGGASPTVSTPAWITPPQSLIDAAKKEGNLTVYSSNTDGIGPTADAFQKTYGIKVRYITNSSSILKARYSTEAQAGKPQADDIMTSISSFYDDNLSKGYLSPMSTVIPDFDAQYPKDWQYKEGQVGIYLAQINGFAYNTDTVKGDDVPTQLSDFAKPFWKGRVIVENPNDSVTQLEFWDFMIQKYGEDVVRHIGANINKKQMQSTFSAMAQAVTAGEGDAVITETKATIDPLVEKGAPLKYVDPPAATGPIYGLGVTANAPHPNASKLFAYWLFGPDGQAFEAKATSGVTPTGGPSDRFVLPNLDAEKDKTKILGLLGIEAGTG